MNLCSERHEEICHEGFVCPACDKIEELTDMLSDAEAELKEANKKIDELEDAP